MENDIRPIRNLTGVPAEGPDFFGRQRELNYVWKNILVGNNYILPSPRRIGKTSFARALMAKAQKESWYALEFNLEGLHDQLDFLEEFINRLSRLTPQGKAKELLTDLTGFFKQIKPTVNMGGVGLSVEWNTTRTDLYDRLQAVLAELGPTLIFLDELTIFLNALLRQENGSTEVRHFMHWLRSLRQSPGTEVRWVVCSSVGIENFTTLHNLSGTINELTSYELRSFKVPTADAMLQGLEQGVKDFSLTPVIRQQIIDKLGYLIPYFIQILFDQMHELHTVEQLPVNEDLVTSAYQNIIEHTKLNTWVERLESQYPPPLNLGAHYLLLTLCNQPATRQALEDNYPDDKLSSIERNQRIGTLLRMLKNDGYLLEEAGQYAFRSPLLRDFWINRYVK